MTNSLKRLQAMKKRIYDNIPDFCEYNDIGPSEFGRLMGVTKQLVHKFKTTYKGALEVRHDEKTGHFELIRVEKILGSGELKRKR